MKLSVLTPLPPMPTGIADYSALLLDALARRDDVDIEAFCPGELEPQSFPVKSPDAFDAGETSGRTMYHVGNSEHHDFLYPYLFDHPDVLVLHDLVVHHARLNAFLESPEVRSYRADLGNVAKRARALAKINAYRAEVVEAYPDRGEAIAEIAVRMGGGSLLYAYPLYEHLVRRARLTLVHATTARDEIRKRCPDADVRRVRMGIEAPAVIDRDEARRRLGLSGGLILASFGLITPEKRIGMALAALRRLRARGVAARYVLVGGEVDHYDARAEAEALGVAEAVSFAGRVSEASFWLHAFAADVCLNLRYPSAGETSATLLRLLACGRPVMVTDQIHAADFPDTVVARTRLEGDEDGLYCDLMDLIRAEARRRELSRRARAFVLDEHSVDAMVDDFVAALGNI